MSDTDKYKIRDCNGPNNIVIQCEDQIMEFKPGEGVFLNGRRLLTESDENIAIHMVKECYPFIKKIDYSRPDKLDDREYWLRFGECPVCRIGSKPLCSRGAFVCDKCGWASK